MSIKKKTDNFTSYPISTASSGEQAIIQKRGNKWYFQMWLIDEKKYYRRSLRTESHRVALERGENELFNIRNKLDNGKTITSLTCKQGVEKYLKHRKGDIGRKIVEGRYKTIETHLTHFLKYIGEQKRLKDLEFDDCMDYFDWRCRSSKKEITPITLKNEQSTINSLICYLRKYDDVDIVKFDFREMSEIRTDSNSIKRQTFTLDEYQRLYKYLRQKYTAKSLKLDDRQMAFRQLIRHWILICANSGMRSGEQRQLRWSDVEITNKQDRTLAKITIRAETSKVRRTRIFYMRSGELFLRLREFQTHKVNNGLVFSVDGIRALDRSVLNKEWHKIMVECGIDEHRQRKIVPYSLRHFCITQRLLAGNSLLAISDMCGTSVSQIEKTYWHTQEQSRIETALK